MRAFLCGLFIGLLLGGGLVWFAIQHWQHAPASEHERIKQEAARAVNAAGEALSRTGEALKARADALSLKPDDIREELSRTGQIVRRQAREVTGQVADAATDARITTVIKGKLAADSELSVWDISVSTSAGRVTLEGKVAAEEHIGRAVMLVLATDGVVDVTARLKVEPRQ
jgi:osmotically-inducible protein OsmY